MQGVQAPMPTSWVFQRAAPPDPRRQQPPPAAHVCTAPTSSQHPAVTIDASTEHPAHHHQAHNHARHSHDRYLQEQPHSGMHGSTIPAPHALMDAAKTSLDPADGVGGPCGSSMDGQAVMQPLNPSADWPKLQQRLSDLRVALDHSCASSHDAQRQVESLKGSLQSKHEENSYLVMQLMEARTSLDLIQANWQGDLEEVRGSMINELQAELQARMRQDLTLQAELQSLQFQLHQCTRDAECRAAAEQQERARLAAELGQSRLLCMARGRQLEELQGELQAAEAGAHGERRAMEDAGRAAQQQVSQLVEQLHSSQSESQQLASALAATQQQLQEAQEQAMQLQEQVQQLHAEVGDMKLQNEWLEGALADAQQPLLGGQEQQQQAQRTAQHHRQQQQAMQEQAAAVQELRGEVQRLTDQLQQQEQQLAAASEHEQALQRQYHALGLQYEQERQALATQLEEAQRARHWAEEVQGRREGPGGESGAGERRKGRGREGGKEGGASSPEQAWADALGMDSEEDERGGDGAGNGAKVAGRFASRAGLGAGQGREEEVGEEAGEEGEGEEGFQDTPPAKGTASRLRSSGPGPGPGLGAPARPPTVDIGVQVTPAVEPEASPSPTPAPGNNPHDMHGGGPGSRGGGAGGSSGGQKGSPGAMALLEAASQEIQRLKEVNQKLLEARGPGSGAGRMVPVEEVRKALAEVRLASNAKAEEALAACAQSWAARLAEQGVALSDAEAGVRELQGKLEEAGGKLAEAERKVERARGEAEAAERRSGEAGRRASELGEALAAAQAAREEAESAAARLEKEAQGLREEVARTGAAREEVEGKLAAAGEKLAAALAEQERLLGEAQRVENAARHEAEGRAAEARAEVEALTAQLEAEAGRTRVLEAELQRVVSERDRAVSERDQAVSEAERLAQADRLGRAAEDGEEALGQARRVQLESEVWELQEQLLAQGERERELRAQLEEAEAEAGALRLLVSEQAASACERCAELEAEVGRLQAGLEQSMGSCMALADQVEEAERRADAAVLAAGEARAEADRRAEAAEAAAADAREEAGELRAAAAEDQSAREAAVGAAAAALAAAEEAETQVRLAQAEVARLRAALADANAHVAELGADLRQSQGAQRAAEAAAEEAGALAVSAERRAAAAELLLSALSEGQVEGSGRPGPGQLGAGVSLTTQSGAQQLGPGGLQATRSGAEQSHLPGAQRPCSEPLGGANGGQGDAAAAHQSGAPVLCVGHRGRLDVGVAAEVHGDGGGSAQHPAVADPGLPWTGEEGSSPQACSQGGGPGVVRDCMDSRISALDQDSGTIAMLEGLLIKASSRRKHAAEAQRGNTTVGLPERCLTDGPGSPGGKGGSGGARAATGEPRQQGGEDGGEHAALQARVLQLERHLRKLRQAPSGRDERLGQQEGQGQRGQGQGQGQPGAAWAPEQGKGLAVERAGAEVGLGNASVEGISDVAPLRDATNAPGWRLDGTTGQAGQVKAAVLPVAAQGGERQGRDAGEGERAEPAPALALVTRASRESAVSKEERSALRQQQQQQQRRASTLASEYLPDVLHGLSLSRVHVERSRLQEWAAAQAAKAAAAEAVDAAVVSAPVSLRWSADCPPASAGHYSDEHLLHTYPSHHQRATFHPQHHSGHRQGVGAGAEGPPNRHATGAHGAGGIAAGAPPGWSWDGGPVSRSFDLDRLAPHAALPQHASQRLSCHEPPAHAPGQGDRGHPGQGHLPPGHPPGGHAHPSRLPQQGHNLPQGHHPLGQPPKHSSQPAHRTTASSVALPAAAGPAFGAEPSGGRTSHRSTADISLADLAVLHGTVPQACRAPTAAAVAHDVRAHGGRPTRTTPSSCGSCPSGAQQVGSDATGAPRSRVANQRYLPN